MMVFLVLLVIGQSTPSLSTSREYQFVHVTKTWSEAQAYCRENFIDLVSMETEEDWADVRQLVADWDVCGVWVGLYDDVKDWRCSVDGEPLDFSQIASLPQLFNGHKSEMHCVAWYNNTLQDPPCHYGFFSVCYDESSSSYVPFSVHRSWESAQQHCREVYTDLTSVKGPQEVEMILGLVDTHSHWSIGLSRGPRKWSDGSNSSLWVWASSQPYGANQDCGCALTEGWHDCPCSMKWPFICRAQTALVFKVGVQTTGSLDLNDPRTQESFLMQIGKQMRNQGIHNRFRLRWMKHSDG